MQRVLKIALATAALGFAAAATPAQAALTSSGTACDATSSYISPSYSACVGYYDDNLLNSSNQTEQQQAIAALLSTPQGVSSGLTAPSSIDWNALVAAGQTYTPTALVGNTFNFGTTLYGWNVLGLHFGNNSDPANPPNNVTAFYLFNFGNTGATGLTFSPNAQGFSNAAIYTPPRGVPEPATWAMMLLGFGGIGTAMRRRRNPALAQIA